MLWFRYELYLRRGCPFPYTTNDRTGSDCQTGAWLMVLSATKQLQTHIESLLPYTRYDVRLQAMNSGANEHVVSFNEFITKPAGI